MLLFVLLYISSCSGEETFPSFSPTQHPATKAPSAFPHEAPSMHPANEPTQTPSNNPTLLDPSFTKNRTSIMFISSVPPGDNSRTSAASNTTEGTLIAVIIVISLLTCLMMIGMYLVCCINTTRNDLLSDVEMGRRGKRSADLSKLWIDTQNDTIHSVDSSIVSPTDATHRLSVFSKIPRVDMFDCPTEGTSIGLVDLGPPQELSDFCEDFEAYFSSPSNVWIGSMKIDGQEERYLELAHTSDGIRRIIDLDTIQMTNKFALPLLELRFHPVKVSPGHYVAQMDYEDINVNSNTTVKLIGRDLDKDRLIVSGPCEVTKDYKTKQGTFRIVSANKARTNTIRPDKRRSLLMEHVGELHQRGPTYGDSLINAGGSTLSLKSEESEVFITNFPNTSEELQE